MRSALLTKGLSVLGVILIVLGFGADISVPSAEAGEVPKPPLVKAYKGEVCVLPVDEMRRDHARLLSHQRDETVREGIRDNKFSLAGCIDCHAVTTPDVADGKVRTVEPFCAACHAYTAVAIDCFQCHSPLAPPDIGDQATLPKDHVPLTKGILVSNNNDAVIAELERKVANVTKSGAPAQ